MPPQSLPNRCQMVQRPLTLSALPLSILRSSLLMQPAHSRAKTSSMNSPTIPSDPFEQPPAETVPTQSQPEPEVEEDPVKKAEKVKETGNVAFKAGRYGEAIDRYTEAISKLTVFKTALPR